MLNYMDECQSCPDAIVAFNSVLALTINFSFDWSIFDARLFKGEIPAQDYSCCLFVTVVTEKVFALLFSEFIRVLWCRFDFVKPQRPFCEQVC